MVGPSILAFAITFNKTPVFGAGTLRASGIEVGRAAIPEATTSGLFALGLCGVAAGRTVWRRRGRRSASPHPPSQSRARTSRHHRGAHRTGRPRADGGAAGNPASRRFARIQLLRPQTLLQGPSWPPSRADATPRSTPAASSVPSRLQRLLSSHRADGTIVTKIEGARSRMARSSRGSKGKR